jgi:replicative DNA helicase
MLVDSSKLERLPPHSVEAEQGVLGCVLLSPNECLGELIETFKGGPEAFYDLRHRSVLELLIEMYDAKEPIDLITFRQRLQDRNQLEGIGGLTYLSALVDSVPSAANLSYQYLILFGKNICSDA